MPPIPHVWFALCAATLAALTAGGWTTLPQARSAWTGVYTTAQADRGRRLYVRECAECHGQNLTGAEGGAALVGNVFLAPWLQKTVGDLYEETSTTMPDSAPGVLPARQYADIVAYLLRENGFPAGDEDLPIELEILKQIRLETKPQP